MFKVNDLVRIVSNSYTVSHNYPIGRIFRVIMVFSRAQDGVYIIINNRRWPMVDGDIQKLVIEDLTKLERILWSFDEK